MAGVPVSAEGVRRLYYDEAFLHELVELCPLEDLDEPFDESDAWWWICASWERMKSYGRKDLRRTARAWIPRIRISDVLHARDLAWEGKFNHLVPPMEKRRRASG